VKLSAASGLLPSALFLAGIDVGENREPVDGGRFADIFRGTYLGKTVAMKRLRIPDHEKQNIFPVRWKLWPSALGRYIPDILYSVSAGKL
jgi:hypothetical protein